MIICCCCILKIKLFYFFYSSLKLQLYSEKRNHHLFRCDPTIIILNVLKYNMLRFLQFWCKLNTRRIVKTCRFRFLRDYYGNSLDIMFSQFPNHFIPFSMVFPHVSPSVSTISAGVSTVSPFPTLDFAVFKSNQMF